GGNEESDSVGSTHAGGRAGCVPRGAAGNRVRAGTSTFRSGARLSGRAYDASVLASLPRRNTHIMPGSPAVQGSSRVSGEVAITATRSSGVVTFAKSIDTSSSASVAFANGAWRMM